MGVLEEAMRYYGIEGAGAKLKTLERYLELLSSMRGWAGLVSKSCAQKPEAAIVDSMGVLCVGGLKSGSEVVDIGSGGGLLGLVLAIVREDWRVALLESNTRKGAFLAEVIGGLNLENAEVLPGRAESFVGERIFDLAVSRAAGRLCVVVRTAIGLLREEGRYVALKGSEVGAEIREAADELSRAGAEVKGIIRPGSPPGTGVGGRTSLVVIGKI